MEPTVFERQRVLAFFDRTQRQDRHVAKIASKADVVAQLLMLQAERLSWLAIERRAIDDRPDAVVDPDMFDQRGTRILPKGITTQILDFDQYIRTSEFNPDAWELVMACDDMLDEWMEWATRVNEINDGAYDDRSRPDAASAWKRFDACLLLIPDPAYKRPEDIRALLGEEGISSVQIANIYDWTLPDGSYDVAKVAEERAQPGRHYKPEEWVSGEEIRRAERIKAQWGHRSVTPMHSRQFHRHDPEAAKAEWQQPPVASEPLEQLLKLPKMTLEQAARMKQITVEEAEAEVAKLGLAVDHSAAVELWPDLQSDPEFELKDMSEVNAAIEDYMLRDIDTHADKGDLPSQVIAMLTDRDDLTDKMMSLALKYQHPNASAELIGTIRTGFEAFKSSMLMPVQSDPVELPSPEPEPTIQAEIDDMTREELIALSKDYGLRVAHNAGIDAVRRKVVSHIAANA